MINFQPKAQEHKSDIFQLNAGMDTLNDPMYLSKGKAVDLLNVDMNDNGPVGRDGLTILGGAENSTIYGYGAIMKDSGDIIVRVRGTKFQKLSAGSWIDVATVTEIVPTMISYQCSDKSGAAVFSGTATSSSTAQYLEVNSGAMTINAYAGKILCITSGTGAGQEILITSNDLTNIYGYSSFETIPDTTSVFEIRNSIPHVIFTNGVDVPFKYDGTTKTDLSAWTKWESIEVAHDRIIASRGDSDNVYISNVGTDFFPKDNYLPVNQNGDTITNISINETEINVYKRQSYYRIIGDDIDSFQLVTADEKIGCIAPKSVAHGNNYKFFLGYEGIFSVQSLDTSSVDEGIPISKDISNLIFAHSTAELEAAVGWVENNKYHISIGNEVFVYHIAQSRLVRTHVWTRYQYADTIKSAMVFQGEIYLGGIQSYIVGGNTDYGTNISCVIETGDKIMKDPNRNKVWHTDIVTFVPNNSNISIYSKMDGGSYILKGTANAQKPIILKARGLSKKIRYKYTFLATNSPEFSTHEQFFSYTRKSV